LVRGTLSILQYMLQEEEEEAGEPGRIEIREKDRGAEELDFQHARIRKIENLHGLSKIQVLGFRYGTPSYEQTAWPLTSVADPHHVDADPVHEFSLFCGSGSWTFLHFDADLDPGLFTLIRILLLI
jgi:hypothetical protein